LHDLHHFGHILDMFCLTYVLDTKNPFCVYLLGFAVSHCSSLSIFHA